MYVNTYYLDNMNTALNIQSMAGTTGDNVESPSFLCHSSNPSSSAHARTSLSLQPAGFVFLIRPSLLLRFGCLRSGVMKADSGAVRLESSDSGSEQSSRWERRSWTMCCGGGVNSDGDDDEGDDDDDDVDVGSSCVSSFALAKHDV